MTMRVIRGHFALGGLLVALALWLAVPLPVQAVTNIWSAAAGLATAREYHTATLLPSGKVLVAGGQNSSGLLMSAELYDPASNSWSAAGSLSTARIQHTATMLPSGKVLIAGGQGSSSAIASAELYDPASNTWSAAGSLATARTAHTATLLLSGKVLVAGGFNGSYPAGAELYDPVTNTWSSAAGLTTTRYGHTATLLSSGQVLVTGGYNGSYLGSAELYDPATNTWSAASSLAIARYGHTATLLPTSQVLVTGGFNGSYPAGAELYDAATNTWSAAGSLAAGRFQHAATLLPSGHVLIAGGQNSSGPLASVQFYDQATNTWSTAGSLAAARNIHTATLLSSGEVLVAGGDDGSVLASAELYDSASHTWSAAGSLASARGYHTATLLPSSQVLVAGGRAGGFLATAELYNPASNTWRAAGSLATARYQHAATLLPSGKVLISGGYNGGALAGAELYDPVTNIWSAAGSLAISRYVHTATLLTSGKVLVAGGYNGGFLTSAELYDPATNTWSAAGSLSTARYAHTATLLASGKVLVAGGFNGSYLASAELYDPASNSWSAAGSLATAHNAHVATLLPSGKVLLAGGQDSSGYLASAELYDPVSNSWSAAGSLATARYTPTATLLASGQVLVAGGFGNSGYPASAELYDPASNTWGAAGTLATARNVHTATLLPSGKVLVTGGNNGSFLASAEQYALDLGFVDSRRPVVSGTNSPLLPEGVLQVTGSGFTGDSEASDGATNNSATNYPVVQLRRIDNDQIEWTSPAPSSIRSATDYQSAPLSALPLGSYALTVLVNAIPSQARVVTVVATLPTTTTITSVAPAPAVVGESFAVGFTIAAASATPTGSVTVSDDQGASCGPVTLASGSGSCVLASTVAGTRTLMASYSPDTTSFAASSSTTAQTVNAAGTTLTIVSETPDPSTPTQMVTLTVAMTVTSPGSGVPTGTISVGDGVDNCTITLPATSCGVAISTRGPRIVTAGYGGDGNFLASTSPSAAHSVNRLPVATADAYTLNEDTTLTINAAQGVLANDSDPDLDTLTVANPGVQTAGGIGGMVTLNADGSFNYTPPLNTSGTATFSYQLSDAYENVSGNVTLTVNFVNQPPTFILGSNPIWPAGTAGLETASGFAQVASFGPPNESGQALLAWHVSVSSDPSGVANGVQIQNDGTLIYSLTGQSGTAVISVTCQDNGGTANGGNDTSAAQTFMVSVSAGLDLSIGMTGGAPFLGDGMPIDYTITVQNIGTTDAHNATVQDPLPGNLLGATWTCATIGTATCTASGSGSISDMVNIPKNAGLIYHLAATVQAIPEFAVVNTATVTAQSGEVDVNPANNSVTLTTAVGIFHSGFESAAAPQIVVATANIVQTQIVALDLAKKTSAAAIAAQPVLAVLVRGDADQRAAAVHVRNYRGQVQARLSWRGDDGLWQFGDWIAVAEFPPLRLAWTTDRGLAGALADRISLVDVELLQGEELLAHMGEEP